MHLHAPHRITVDNLRVPVQRFGLRVQLADLRFQFIAEAGIFLDRLGTNVREVDEAAGNRQVRRRGDGATGSHACSGLTSMKSAPVLLCESTMRVLRSSKSPTPQDPADRMEYSWAIQPHNWSCSMAGSIGNTLGGADQRGVLRAVAHLDMQRMVSHRQIAGMVMDAVATNLPSTSYACDPSPAPGSSAPWYSSPFSSVMVAERNLHDTGVEQHTIFLADDMQHGRGDETPVALAKDTDNGIIDGVIVIDVHAQRTNNAFRTSSSIS